MVKDRELGKATARLPEELIVEILVKLPVKSLLRFWCVCKSWLVLIKSPHFINMHLKHQCDCILVSSSDKITGLLSLFSYESLKSDSDRYTSLLSLFSYESLKSDISSQQLEKSPYNCFVVGQSCNGLLCLFDYKTIVLCNPIMREFKVLPPGPFQCPKQWEYHVKSVELGFDSNSNDYKVVTIIDLLPKYRGGKSIYKAEIYNLTTNAWTEIEHDHGLPCIRDDRRGTLLKESFHWIALGNNIEVYGKKVNVSVLAFDMGTELFRYMELPQDERIAKHDIISGLTVLHESLALFVGIHPWYITSKDFQFIDIWIMHKYGVAESWTKQFIIGPLTGGYYPVLLWKNEAILLRDGKGRLFSCALDTHEINDFANHDFLRTKGAMVYQESLVSIK